MKSPRIHSQKQTASSLHRSDETLPGVPSRFASTESAGDGNQLKRVKADGLYLDLLGVSLQPTTEISPNDGMHFFNFKFQLADSYLTSAQQNHISHHLLI